MAELNVVGVYPVQGEPDVHLVEIASGLPPYELDISAFAQEDPGQPRENWQAAYDEHYLDSSGTELLGHFAHQVNNVEPPARVVFFLHYLDPARPLLTPGVAIDLPDPSPMPDRLASIVSYEAP